MTNQAPPNCLGILGKLFGHKFRKGIDYVTESAFCYRCGWDSGRRWDKGR